MYKKMLAAAMALLWMWCAPAFALEARDLTGSCAFHVSEGRTKYITDRKLNSAWKPSKPDAELAIKLPEDDSAAYIRLDWTLPAENYQLIEYDAEGNALRTRTAEDDFPCLSQLFDLDERARYVSLRFTQQGQGVNKVRVYSSGDLPATMVRWEPPCEKCDLMVISTHQDDEWLWFGGIIPYYDLVRQKDVQVMYMANCGRYRYEEALNGLAVAGVRTYPVFLGLKDKFTKSMEESISVWGGKKSMLGRVVEQIRRFRPEVILTHDWDGEYGHRQHKLTSRIMEEAIEAAADPDQYPESAAQYGAWQVKKLYRHLEENGQIEFDWHVAYPELGGRTGLEVATEAMAQHASQLKSYRVEDHGKYDNALFGLSYSTVGEDERHDDLFEHIDEALDLPPLEPSIVVGAWETAEAAPVEADDGGD